MKHKYFSTLYKTIFFIIKTRHTLIHTYLKKFNIIGSAYDKFIKHANSNFTV